jgi:NAD(P)-dependent dehydrogenase (short-subunit alcohol dehydrogenase family)
VELAGASAIVTGGASGIGAATVALLRGAGARVAVLDIQQGSAPAELYIRCDI